MHLNISKPPAVLSVDILFTWHSNRDKRECQCHLIIYKLTFDTAVVIVSGLPENQSSSIIGERLTLIPLICQKFASQPTKTMWLEHYPKEDFKEEETYEHVMLLQGNVCSKRIKKEQIEALLGVKLK